MDRKILELKENWRFCMGECEEAWYKGYDDSGWQRVMVPHDWSVEYPFSKTCSSGTGYLVGGIGWYRLRFSLPEEYRGMSIRLVFDGIYKNSQVWCNSYYLGKRPSGYVSFSYDISDFAVFGERDNEISVKVTHTDIADSRWFTGSGITRKVTLVVEEPVHPVEYGCFFETKDITYGSAETDSQPQSAEQADIRIAHQIKNASEAPVLLSVETELCETDGRVAAFFVKKILLQAGQTDSLSVSGKIEKPYLWSTVHPYCYTMKTWYRQGGQERYLADEQKVGIRTAAFDPDRGFFLNGVETKLKGVCVHHDGGALGAAMKKEVWQRRLRLLKECGCNAIRCSHNPHMPELYELCDAMGFLMMDEAFDEWENPKNKWSAGHNVYPPKHQGYYEDFHAWHEADLRAMVRRDRNHPSVILWSIGNEIDYPNDPYCHPMFETMAGNNDADKPEAEQKYDGDKPDAGRLPVLAKHLAQIVRNEDKSRPVTLAAAFPELSSRLGFLDPLDVVGYNYKEHLYEEDHSRFPGKSFLGSENGHTYEAWRAVTEHPYVSGQFLWTGIDYLGEAKGWPVHGSGAGIITTAGFPKPEFYRRKSFWTEEVTLQLATRRADWGMEEWLPMSYSWNYEPGTRVFVKCYAGLPEKNGEGTVALLCNGREIDRQGEYTSDGAFAFLIDYEPGVLEARYYDPRGQAAATCTLTTTKPAAGFSCELWREKDAVTGEDWECTSKRTGYLYQILITLKDEEDHAVVWDDREICVQVQGAGELAGLDNGNLADVTPFAANTRKTYGGKLAVYVRRTGPGRVKVLVGGTYEMEMD